MRLLPLMLLVLSCAHIHPVSEGSEASRVWMEPELRESYEGSLVGAVDWWNSTTKCRALEYTTGKRLATIQVISGSYDGTIAEFVDGYIIVRQPHMIDVMTGVFMHELGHGLGLEHSRSYTNVMYPNLGEWRAVRRTERRPLLPESPLDVPRGLSKNQITSIQNRFCE